MPRKQPPTVYSKAELTRMEQEKADYDRAKFQTLQKIIDAEPGTEIVYRKGNAEREREPELAGAREAFYRGFCELFQRRVTEEGRWKGQLVYVAVRRKVVKAPRQWSGGYY